MARHPLTVAGMRRLVDLLADTTVQTCKRLDAQEGVGATVQSSLDLDGEFSVTREGEITFSGRASTNVPTDPVAGEVGGEVSRSFEGGGDGTLKITFRVTAEIR